MRSSARLEGKREGEEERREGMNANQLSLSLSLSLLFAKLPERVRKKEKRKKRRPPTHSNLKLSSLKLLCALVGTPLNAEFFFPSRSTASLSEYPSSIPVTSMGEKR